ncbi:RNA polymerase sigma factor [Hymenobacter aerophilus]|uniref:RNA polymerase sigma factor n=1 Tax=Hymenobacter aerophilus TaxID=119644 RepID=UPI0003770AC7|nr:sigma-70 family RNA polymerase sigma factor [Hymenobacter aerophilus]
MSCLQVESASEKELSVRAHRDQALVRAALAGQARAYEALWTYYRKPVFYLILKMVPHADDAEDLTMEALGKAFRHLPSYTPAFAFSTWLFRIATNTSIDFLRRQRVSPLALRQPAAGSGELPGREDNSPEPEVQDPEPDPLEGYIQQQRQQWVRQMVGRLPLKYVPLVQLRYFEERSYEEIATALDLPLGTVKAFLSKARKLLLALMQDSSHLA